MLEKHKKRYRKVYSGEKHNYYAKKNCKHCNEKGIIVTTYPNIIENIPLTKIAKKYNKGKVKIVNRKCSCVISEEKGLESV